VRLTNLPKLQHSQGDSQKAAFVLPFCRHYQTIWNYHAVYYRGRRHLSHCPRALESKTKPADANCERVLGTTFLVNTVMEHRPSKRRLSSTPSSGDEWSGVRLRDRIEVAKVGNSGVMDSGSDEYIYYVLEEQCDCFLENTPSPTFH
jgi:hypothetical protein